MKNKGTLIFAGWPLKKFKVGSDLTMNALNFKTN